MKLHKYLRQVSSNIRAITIRFQYSTYLISAQMYCQFLLTGFITVITQLQLMIACLDLVAGRLSHQITSNRTFAILSVSGSTADRCGQSARLNHSDRYFHCCTTSLGPVTHPLLQLIQNTLPSCTVFQSVLAMNTEQYSLVIGFRSLYNNQGWLFFYSL